MTPALLRDALALTVGFIGGASVAWFACVLHDFTVLHVLNPNTLKE